LNAVERAEAEKRLLARRLVTKTGCWEYQGGRVRGYGMLSVAGRTMGAHRLAALLWLDFEPAPGRQVMHECDNPPCFNPGHLTIGDARTNVLQARIRGRHLGAEYRDRDLWRLRDKAQNRATLATPGAAPPGRTRLLTCDSQERPFTLAKLPREVLDARARYRREYLAALRACKAAGAVEDDGYIGDGLFEQPSPWYRFEPRHRPSGYLLPIAGGDGKPMAQG
jgi:hypothetical protein